MSQDSRLDENTTSHVGAIGVTQVMPATGNELDVGDIRKVDSNIHAGVKYIRFLIDRYFTGEPMDDLNKGLFSRRLTARTGTTRKKAWL